MIQSNHDTSKLILYDQMKLYRGSLVLPTTGWSSKGKEDETSSPLLNYLLDLYYKLYFYGTIQGQAVYTYGYSCMFAFFAKDIHKQI